jgi:predicted acetyltransferase
MHIDILDTTSDDRPVFRHLMELYLYDHSEFMGWDVGADGRFGDDDLEGCWIEAWRHPFLVQVDNRLAGFAIVDQRSHLTGDPHVWDMAEFFIMRKYRRQGVGEHVAIELFTRFPGPWEVRERAENGGAVKFWRRVIARYTSGQFREGTGPIGPVQFFVSSV